MGQPDPRVDVYIGRQAEFAQPILQHLRAAVHAACPAAEETLKWGMPHFMYGGKILCGMAAFRQHASFGFWHGEKVVGDPARPASATSDKGKAGQGIAGQGMGQFGRLARLDDLPGERAFTGYIKQAMSLIDAGVTRASKRAAKPRPPLSVPDDLALALAGNGEAQATFDAFAPSHRREYIEWVSQAKREQTRQRRLAQAIEWLAQGKSRNWKYLDC